MPIGSRTRGGGTAPPGYGIRLPSFRLPTAGVLAYSLGTMANPVVGIIMGSTSDWETMQHCASTLDQLGIPYEKRAISAHRTPDIVFEWCRGAEGRGIKVIIAAAGGV